MNEFFQEIDLENFAEQSLVQLMIKETYDEYVEELIDKALDSWELGNIEEALNYCDEFLEFRPDSGYGIVVYAGLLHSNHEFDASSDLMDRILPEFRPYADALFNFFVGLDYFIKEEYRESIKFLSKTIEFKKDFYIAYYPRAMSYTKLGLHRFAVPDYKKALKSNEDTEDIKANLAFCYVRLRSFRKAHKIHKEIVHLYPDNKIIVFNSALTFLLYKKYDKSIELLNQCIEIDPNFSVVYYIRGFIYYKKKDKTKALEDWMHAEKLGSKIATKMLYKYSKGYFPFTDLK